MSIRVFVLLSVGIGAVLLSSCGTGDQPSTETPSPLSAAGGLAPIYDEPKLIVPGDYLSAAFEPDALEEGIKAAEEDRSKGVFHGEIEGVLLVSGAEEYHAARDVCGDSNLSGFIEGDIFSFGYLPPGTWATRPQISEQCPDGSIPSAGQEFQTSNTTFGVWFYFGTPAVLAHNASSQRIRSQELDGQTIVVIQPVTSVGYGESWIAIPNEAGMLMVRAYGLPVEQTLAIAKGVECDICSLP